MANKNNDSGEKEVFKAGSKINHWLKFYTAFAVLIPQLNANTIALAHSPADVFVDDDDDGDDDDDDDYHKEVEHGSAKE